jgi:hypothetical protein
LGFSVKGLGFKVEELGVWGFRVEDLEFKV